MLTGRQHDVFVPFCPCESRAMTLYRCGLWPASPKEPVAALHLDFMKLCRVMLLESHVSVSGFATTMNGFYPEMEHPSPVSYLFD
jgi:hypothetical protein